MTKYAVNQLSKLAGVSVRTLHHYDKIGLLKPSHRSEKGYRFYERTELLKLQQILFYKELQFPLAKIKEILNDPSFDLENALKFHKEEIETKVTHMQKLLQTIDKTLLEVKNKKIMKEEEIYAGFNPEEVKSIKEEVVTRWGEEELLEVEERIKAMGKSGWEDTQKKGEEINQMLADLIDLPAEDMRVQKVIELHFKHLNQFYEVSKERYLGLSQLYVEDERFKAHYEKYQEGLADFIRQAIEVFCDNDLSAQSS